MASDASKNGPDGLRRHHEPFSRTAYSREFGSTFSVYKKYFPSGVQVPQHCLGACSTGSTRCKWLPSAPISQISLASRPKNLQHVYGYVDSTGTQVPLSAQALISYGSDLILANQNTSVANAKALTSQNAPYTILHTTASGFSFFNNTQSGPGGFSPSVYITPGAAGISVVSAANGATVLGYTATGGADIDLRGTNLYRFAYNATSSGFFSVTPTQNTGALIKYNLATQTETLLSPPSGLPLANVYPSPEFQPWSQLTFNPQNNHATLTIPSALGISSSVLCSSVSIDQVLGGGLTYASLGEAATNYTSGYVYDTESIYPNTTLYYVTPPASCAAATLAISPTVLPTGIAGQPYTQQFTVPSGAVGSVTFTQVSNVAGESTLMATATLPVPRRKPARFPSPLPSRTRRATSATRTFLSPLAVRRSRSVLRPYLQAFKTIHIVSLSRRPAGLGRSRSSRLVPIRPALVQRQMASLEFLR